MYSLKFAYPHIFYYFFPALWCVLGYKIFLYRSPLYHYSLTSMIARHALAHSGWHRRVLFLLRLGSLVTLIFIIARPIWTEKSSLVYGEGRDIVLAIDISGSMQLFDDLQDRRSRIDVAKQEAISFIKKRTEDPLGIVVFAADALSLCPLTLDKHMLISVIEGLELGFISPQGTSLGTGLATAINRLRKSSAKTKIVILLTDGKPTPETDKISPEAAIALAQRYGIKVYTIGIGGEEGGIVLDAFGVPHAAGVAVDNALLEKIAQQTGGVAFRANNPAQMKQIYQAIDKLEKTSYQTNIFQHFYEAAGMFFWILMLLVFAELLLRLFIVRGI